MFWILRTLWIDMIITKPNLFPGKPHNPMINAGAIVTTSLLKPKMQIADRFDYVSG